MDAAYQQHSSQARRKNRSSTNLNHLSLAPLTTKLPIADPDALPGDLDTTLSTQQYNVSYLQGKSAPTTPRLFSRSPAATRGNSPRRPLSLANTPSASLPKSKSASHLHSSPEYSRNRGRSRPSPTSSTRRRKDDLDAQHHNDGDWLLRTGALISTEAREYKGQNWLVSRASSTSLTGVRDTEEEAYERELAREKELSSRRGSRSRRGSLGGLAAGVAQQFDEDAIHPGSRYGSRSQSRKGSRSQLFMTPTARTPRCGGGEDLHGYFPQDMPTGEYLPGPDFVNLDETLENAGVDGEADTSLEDEATVKRLVKRDNAGQRAHWMGNLLGWSLFAVDEQAEDDESSDDSDAWDGEEEEEGHGQDGPRMKRNASARHLAGIINAPPPESERMPPPKADDGGWHDAAWLLSVASKVLL